MRLKNSLLIILITVFSSTFSTAQQLLKDINPQFDEGEDFQNFYFPITNINDTLWMNARLSGQNDGLWTSDGTASGTKFIKNAAIPHDFVSFNNTVYFAGPNGLWKSDGTAQGTQLIKSLAWVNHLTVVNQSLFFEGQDSNSNGIELWKSDGTTAGTVMVKDVNPSGSGLGKTGSFLIDLNGILIFGADDGNTGTILWKSDGTTAGTQALADSNGFNVNITFAAALNDHYVVMNNILYFVGEFFFVGEELFRTDGTSAGTYIVKDIRSGMSGATIHYMKEYNGHLYFNAHDGSDGELWRSDGTAAGTTLFKDINPTASSTPGHFAVSNGYLYFNAYEASTARELWRTDGTVNGTVLVSDINSNGSSQPENLTDVNGTLYFIADDGTSKGEELWKSDGTSAGTVMVKDINPGNLDSKIYSITGIGDTLFFVADHDVYGKELWMSDGTNNGTIQVSNTRSFESSHASNFTPYNGDIYLRANDNSLDMEVWKIDGNTLATNELININPGSTGSNPSSFQILNDKLFFVATTSSHGREPWITDGTATNTFMLKDININNNSSNIDYSSFNLINDTLFFVAFNGSTANIWKTDGTIQGTTNTNIGANGSGNNTFLTKMGNYLYYVHTDPVTGREIWKTDGTLNGTMILKDINPNGGSRPRDFVALNNMLYFLANDGTHGTELWQSDGTTAGTIMLKDINVGAANTWQNSGINLVNPYFHIVDSLLFFVAQNNIHGAELWRTDGTANGTVLVKDIHSGIKDGINFSLLNQYSPTPFGKMNGQLYFPASDGIHGEEVWTSDGTTNGTVLVKDIEVGDGNSSPQEFVYANNKLYFRAYNSNFGIEIWETDGTTNGTQLLADIYTGGGSSSPFSFTPIGDTLYFTADDGVHGIEPWFYSLNCIQQEIQTVTLCQGDSIIVGNNIYLNAGTYIDTLSGSVCDTIVTTLVNTFIPNDTLQTSICAGSTFELFGQSFNASGFYTFTLGSCNANYYLDLAVIQDSVFINDNICEGEVFSYNGNTYTQAGTYYTTLSSPTACDTIVEIQLGFSSTIQLVDTSIIYDDGTGTGMISLTLNGGTPPFTYQWNNDSTMQNLQNVLAGLYTVTVTDALGCSNDFSFDIFTVHTNQLLRSDIQLFPNPTNGLLNINIPNDFLNKEIMITNILGQKIISSSVNHKNTMINLDKFPAGTYFVNIYENSRLIYMDKIILQSH